MESYLRFKDNKSFFLEDVDIRESLESYMAKVDVWGVSYSGSRWKTSGGVFEILEDKVVFVLDMEVKT